MIQTSHVSFTYKSGKAFTFPDLCLPKGEQAILKGKSGSGKTTLLHILAGILQADSGSVFINQTDIQQPGFKETDRFRGRHIGLIFQKHYFLGSLTMEENLYLAPSLPGLPADRNYIRGLMSELEISKLSRRYPKEISQGELQRFSMARAMANKPLVLLADEPTSSLDDENCIRFIQLLKRISTSHGATLLIATHDQRLLREFSTVFSL